MDVGLGGESSELFLLVGGEPEVPGGSAGALRLDLDADDAHVRSANADGAAIALLCSHLFLNDPIKDQSAFRVSLKPYFSGRAKAHLSLWQVYDMTR